MATYAFDDEPTLTSAKVTGTNTVTLEFSEELVGGSTDAFVVSTNGVSNTVSGFAVSGSTVTLTLGTDVQPGDETQVSYVSGSAGTLKDVDEGGKTVSITNSTVATYAFDDVPSLTSAKVTGTNTVTLEFSEELVGGSTNAFAVSTNGVSNTVSGLSGSTVTLTLGTDVQPGDETQVSYVSSTATLKDVDEEERRSRLRIQRWRPMRLMMSRR